MIAKIRKDGNFDERRKGANEINQASSFLGSIFGLLTLPFSIWRNKKSIGKTQKELEKKLLSMPDDEELMNKWRNLGKDEDGKQSNKE